MKKYIFTLIITIIAGFCIVSPVIMIDAAKSALSLWATIIIPSLFPFMIIADLIQKTALPYIFEKLLTPVMKAVFNLPGITSIAIFLGMTGGYPIGAKITTDMVNENQITKSDANHLITFVNNSGPLFILGAVGVGIYKSACIGSLLLISHYLSALITGLIFRFIFKEKTTSPSQKVQIKFQVIKLSQLGTTLSNTIKKSIDIVLIIGGFILLFSIVSAILEQTGILALISKIIFPMFNEETAKAIITGILEVTNGVNKTAMVNIPLLQKILITSVLIGFGGFSIHFQTLSILSGSPINFKNYLLGKSFHGIFSGIITFLLLRFTIFADLIPLTVSSPLYNNPIDFSKILNTITAFLIFSVLFKILQTLIIKNPFKIHREE